MVSRRRVHTSPPFKLLTLVLALGSCCSTQAAVAAKPAAQNGIDVKLVFPGLNQNIFDRKYGNAALSALAISAGVPAEYITWVSRPGTAAAAAAASKPAAPASTAKPATATVANSTTAASNTTATATAAVTLAPAAAAATNTSSKDGRKAPAAIEAATAEATPPAAANPAAATATASVDTKASNITTPPATNATTADTAATAPAEDKPAATPAPASASSGNVTLLSNSNVTLLSSSTKTPSTKGARRLLAAAAPAAADVPVQSGAVAIYRIKITTENWATPEAITEKLQTASAPPGYAFLANLERRGVPYEPTVYVKGAMVLEGRPAFSGNPRQIPVAVSSTNDALVRAALAAKSADAMYGPLPQWVFIAIVVLAGLVALLLVVGTCVAIWLAVRACSRRRRKQEEERERGQFIKSGDSSDAGSDGLARAPGGGFAPTQGALEQLNASFPSATPPTPKSPGSVASADVRSVTTNCTTATTVRSNVGLMSAPDGKKGRAAKNSNGNIADSNDMEFYRQYAKDGKPVPILPHSRVVKPSTSSIRVPSITNGSIASVAEQQQQQPE